MAKNSDRWEFYGEHQQHVLDVVRDLDRVFFGPEWADHETEQALIEELRSLDSEPS